MDSKPETDPRPWWKPALAFARTGAVVLLLVVALNVLVDPRAEFGTGAFRPLTSANEGELKLQLAANHGPVQTLVLGSSRAMKLAPRDLEAAGFGPSFNLAFSGATIQDIRTAYGRVAGTPRDVVLALDADQWSEDRQIVWPSEAGGTSSRVAAGVGNAVESISLSYVADSLVSLRYAAFGDRPAAVGYDPDGAFTYLDWEAMGPADRLEFQAWQLGLVLDGLDTYRFPHPSPGQLDAFRNLVSDIAADGARLHVFITPYHPEVLPRMQELPGFNQAVEGLRALALELCADDARVHDFTDVSSFAGSARDFRDGTHYGPDNARLLVQALARGDGDLCLQAPVDP